MRVAVLPPLALLALVACKDAPVVNSFRANDPAWPEPVPLNAPPSREEANRDEAACATLRDAEGGDVIHANGEGRVLYAHAEIGLAIVDVTIPDAPRLTGTSSFVGTPLGVFERGEVGLVVFVPWDGKPQTTIRAVDLGPDRKARTIGEISLAGVARDVRRVGDALVLTRDSTTDADGLTIVTSVAVGTEGLGVRDEILLRGRGAVMGASAWGIAIAREAEKAQGPDRTAVTYVSVGNDGLGSLRPHGTSVIDGVVPRWRRANDGVIDVSEDNRIRVVACANAACPPGTPATFATIEYGDLEAPRTVSWAMIANAGADGVVRFDGERLIVARQTGNDGTTEVAFFDAIASLKKRGSVRVRGTVAALAPREDSVVTLGWTGDASAGKRAIVHRIDTRSMRLRGSASFGRDWTWSPAWDDDRALSFDPGSALAAFPMTTIAPSGAPVSAVQILTLGKTAPRAVDAIEADAPTRLLFVEGHLLAFGSGGVTVLAPDELRSLIR